MVSGPLRFVAVGAGLGFIVPVVFRILYGLQSAESSLSPAAWSVLDYVQLMLWPIPLLLVPTDEPGAVDLVAWGPFAVATLANVSLYGIVAVLLWAGLARWKPLLVVPVALVGGIWYAVWRT